MCGLASPGSGLSERKALNFLPFFFSSKQIQKQPDWGLRARRACREAAPSVQMGGRQCSRLDGPGEGQQRGAQAHLGRLAIGGHASPSTCEAVRDPGVCSGPPTVPSVLGPRRLLPSATPLSPLLSNRKCLPLSMFPPLAWTQLSPARSRGDFQETVIVKNPNHCQPAASNHLG